MQVQVYRAPSTPKSKTRERSGVLIGKQAQVKSGTPHTLTAMITIEHVKSAVRSGRKIKPQLIECGDQRGENCRVRKTKAIFQDNREGTVQQKWL